MDASNRQFGVTAGIRAATALRKMESYTEEKMYELAKNAGKEQDLANNGGKLSRTIKVEEKFLSKF